MTLRSPCAHNDNSQRTTEARDNTIEWRWEHRIKLLNCQRGILLGAYRCLCDVENVDRLYTGTTRGVFTYMSGTVVKTY